MRNAECGVGNLGERRCSSRFRTPHSPLRIRAGAPVGEMNLVLSGKTVLVTGGTRGIGHAIAKALVAAGAKVAICGRDAVKAEAAAAGLGGGAKGYVCDVADPAQVEKLLETVEHDLGPIDVLVNNAGITKDNMLFRIG